MGWTDDAASRIRHWVTGSSDSEVMAVRRSSSNKDKKKPVGRSAWVFGGEGAETLSTNLKLEGDLHTKYIDYEEMDDYPEIACLTGDSIVTIATIAIGDMHVSQIEDVTIDELVSRRSINPGFRMYVIAVNHKTGRITPSASFGPFKTGTSVKIVKVTYIETISGVSTEKTIRCTPEHLFMHRDGSYIPAMNLTSRMPLMSCAPIIDLHGEVDVACFWDVSKTSRSRNNAKNRIKIELSKDVVSAAVLTSAGLADAAKKLDTTVSIVKSKMIDFLIPSEFIGLSMQSIARQPNDIISVVVSVVDDGVSDVWDIMVPNKMNLLVNGVFVHNSAIDIFADDSTITDTMRGTSVWATSEDRVVGLILDDLLHRVLRIDNEIWGLCRTLVKYGNVFGELIVSKNGVVGIGFMPPPTVRRIDDSDGTNIGFVHDADGMFQVTKSDIDRIRAGDGSKSRDGTSTLFESWEVVHWRLRSKQMTSVYGTSVLDPVRWVWRRLLMMEDSVLTHRLTRSPARFAFYVDVSDVPTDQAAEYLRRIKNLYKKKKFINPATGQLDYRANPLSPQEDFWIPVRDGKESTRIDIISGPTDDSMESVEYFRSKLFAGIKVPKSYMGLAGESNRASLSQEDVRFARTAIRIQREVRNGIKEVCRVHLASIGIDPDTIKWDIRMSAPSSIFEMGQMEVMQQRASLASSLSEWFPSEWIVKNIFHLPSDDSLSVLSAKQDETKNKAKAAFELERELQSRP